MGNPMMLTDMVKLYVKPSLGGQIIMRKPRTVQKSPRVKNQQMVFANKMKGKKIATECRGRKGRSFYGCLKTAGHNAYSGARA
mgnify:CR=1 FL=1